MLNGNLETQRRRKWRDQQFCNPRFKYHFRMAESIFAHGISVLLLLSAMAHILLPHTTDRCMSRPGVVRFTGAVLLLLAVPCLWWRGWFFWSLFAALFISGAWRLCFPRHSIHAQQQAYPRWVHACLLLAGAILVWTLRS
jgi:hypothetical protein